MEALKNLFSFLAFTVSDSKAIYAGTAGGGITSKAVLEGGEVTSLILTYTPTAAVLVAALKLSFDLYRWRKGLASEV